MRRNNRKGVRAEGEGNVEGEGKVEGNVEGEGKGMKKSI